MQYVGEKHTTRDTAGLGGAEQDQGRAGQGRAVQGRAGQCRAGQGKATDYVYVSPAASEMNLLQDRLHGRNTTPILPQAHLHDSATRCNCLHCSLQNHRAL